MPKVMVIDDEPFILMMIEEKLERAGLDVVTLRESKVAVDTITKEKPDLIILDWMMPEITGIDICKMLKANSELANIPVFMLTSKEQDNAENMEERHGVHRYITKPFSPQNLLENVLEQLGNR